MVLPDLSRFALAAPLSRHYAAGSDWRNGYMNLVRKLILLAVSALLGFFVVASIKMGLFYGPWPWQSPQEADRVHHSEGYSIIKPHGWIHKLVVQPSQSPYLSALRLHPDTQARLCPLIIVGQFASPPDIGLMKTSVAYRAGGFRDASFQKGPAQIYEGNAGKYWDWKVLLERDGRWFQITVMSPSENETEDHVQQNLLPYVESFQLGKAAASDSGK